jgi:hypothetical protein
LLVPTGFDSFAATSNQSNDLRNHGQSSAAKSGAVRQESTSNGATSDPALVALIDAWPDLPADVKAGILAMVENSHGQKACCPRPDAPEAS